MKILNAVLTVGFFITMLYTDDVGEKIEFGILTIICYLSLISNSLYEIVENKS